MKFTIVLFAVTVLFLLAGAIPWTYGDSTAVFQSPVFIALLGSISLLSLYCCRKRMRQPSFLMPHLGAVVILAGALLTFIFGKNTEFKLPVMHDMIVDNIPAPDGSQWDLGFSFSVADFRTEYYAPSNDDSPAIPKNYEAKMRIVPKNGNEFTTVLKVNHPVSYGGWRIYLVSFGNDPVPYVQLSAKKDIGRGAVIAGIWMLMAGTFIICFKRKERL